MTDQHHSRRFWTLLKRPPWRTVVAVVVLLLLGLLVYAIWSPGEDVTDGRHDRGRNAIWLQHGWLGDDLWFRRNNKEDQIPRFRRREEIRKLAALLRRHHIRDVFPHLCPTKSTGELPGVDSDQAKRLLDEFAGFRALPWVGGVRHNQAYPQRTSWRRCFVASVVGLLEAHPRLAGIHVNIEPCASGSADFLALLDELRTAMPQGKILSVAAYPPPTFWQRVPEVHWDRAYYREVAGRVDQLAVMMYDTSIRFQKPYRHLMVAWTKEVLEWSGDTEVLLGLPAYDDPGVGYHRPDVENLPNALLGIHAALLDYPSLPADYAGAAIYCEWEMSDTEWRHFREHFLRAGDEATTR